MYSEMKIENDTETNLSELPYPTEDEFSDSSIIPYLVENLSFSIPPKPRHGSRHFTLTHPILGSLLLPLKYRLPLLWTHKYTWHSLYLVLTVPPDLRKTEWETFKYRILHLGREIFEFLTRVKRVVKPSHLWRCTFFDRVLVRFWDEYLINDPEAVDSYEKQIGTRAYQDDILRKGNVFSTWLSSLAL